MGGCLGLGENAEGILLRADREEGDSLPMEFRLYDARGQLCFEGRCGDIDADWWHGFEPLIFAWNSHARCRRLTYRRADPRAQWRSFAPFPHR
ncbi:hypothetical protein GCM10007897_11090 [Sphingobium jiangsuense]|uniref:Uncharacterized protein n=1 Tax=Sphingobium jiangsuense TaxID=870476 RepID=A0A7W6BHY3_9SPHN|nr:hypothetical protein [Sphingobium jiangsuense]MBB3926344.1 hypothetical protein [Sphingobium jiangsuense]GLS99726.1 hypothetical protein GCM10007897_11090 [Sphingobium jiangsuense]